MINIGIDISVNSTAMCIYDNDYDFYNYTTKKSNYKWYKKTTDFINYRYFDFDYKKIDNFSDKLLTKIINYDQYTDSIINDIKKYGSVFNIGIEGYNYGLKTTDSIIDISELSSILKLKLLREFPDSNMYLIPPKSVKIKTCEFVYRKNPNEKKVRNKKGVAGGNFDKTDMFDALLDSELSNKLKDYLLINIDELKSMKNLPKPFDDIIDSLFIMEIVKNEI